MVLRQDCLNPAVRPRTKKGALAPRPASLQPPARLPPAPCTPHLEPPFLQKHENVSNSLSKAISLGPPPHLWNCTAGFFFTECASRAPQLSGQNGVLKGGCTGRLSLPSVGSGDDSDGGRAPTEFFPLPLGTVRSMQ